MHSQKSVDLTISSLYVYKLKIYTDDRWKTKQLSKCTNRKVFSMS